MTAPATLASSASAKGWLVILLLAAATLIWSSQAFAEANQISGNLSPKEEEIVEAYKAADPKRVIEIANSSPEDGALQFFAASIFIGGKTSSVKENIAFKLMLRSARDGDLQAQYFVGDMYMFGQGVLKDERQAAIWWQESANKGFKKSERSLGSAYANGVGVQKDYDLAFKWLSAAADQGDPAGLRELGSLYADGLGRPKDQAKALIYYKKAAALGDEKAARFLRQGSQYIAVAHINGAAVFLCTSHARDVTHTPLGSTEGAAFKAARARCLKDIASGHDYERPQKF